MRVMLVAVAIATAVLGVASSIVIARQGRGGGEAPPVLTVEKLQDDLFVRRRGPRANSGVFIGQRGVTIVDVRGGWGQPLRDAIANSQRNPLRRSSTRIPTQGMSPVIQKASPRQSKS